MKSIIADNQLEVPKYRVIPKKISFEEFEDYVFVGIRRAGKSFLLYQRMQQFLSQGVGWDEMLYINFEDERLVGMCVDDLNLLLEIHLEMYSKRPILFLNEIQNIASWEKFARRMADTKHRVYITGSKTGILIKLSKALDCSRLMIITYSEERTIEVENKTIEVLPIWKWLLD